MKIALSAALVLGLAQYAAAFPCTWNGAGSSYVYHDVDTNSCCACNCGDAFCDQNCLCDLDNDWGQTTCCRCATAGECEQAQPQDWDQDGNTWQGCDLYAPDVFINDAVEAASAPGMWFTSTTQLQTFLEATVSCTDDCSPEPTCVKSVVYPPNGDNGNCQAYVTVRSQDRDYDVNNCVNVNTEEKSFYVRYDAVAPVVTVSLGNYLNKKSADGRKYEDIPLTITVSDNCDPNPEVIVTVFSDETTVTHEFDDKPAAVLERKYSNIGPNGVLQGWGVTLDRYSYAKKLCGPHMECLEADGRFYTVRVCAKDYAGWTTCAEDTVGVPLTPTELKHIVPEDQGKMFIVAEDAGFWQAPPNEIPFRNENLFLANQPSNFQQAKLCWANYALITSGAGSATFTVLSGDYNNDMCWRACGTTSGCIGYQLNYNNGDCALVTNWGDGLLRNGVSGMPAVFTGLNIYAMANVVCPDKNEVQPN